MLKFWLWFMLTVCRIMFEGSKLELILRDDCGLEKVIPGSNKGDST